MAKQSNLRTGVEIGGGVVATGGVVYALYELYEWISWKRYKVKNPTATITFADYKKTKPV